MTETEGSQVQATMERVKGMKLEDAESSEINHGIATSSTGSKKGRIEAISTSPVSGPSTSDTRPVSTKSLPDITYEHTTPQRIDIHGGTFIDVLFSGGKIQDCLFVNCTFKEVRFRNCNLSGLAFHNVTLRDVYFEDCRFQNTLWVDLKEEHEFHYDEDFDQTVFGNETRKRYDDIDVEETAKTLGISTRDVACDFRAWENIQKQREKDAPSQCSSTTSEGGGAAEEMEGVAPEDWEIDRLARWNLDYHRTMVQKWAAGTVPSVHAADTVQEESHPPQTLKGSVQEQVFAPSCVTPVVRVTSKSFDIDQAPAETSDCIGADAMSVERRHATKEDNEKPEACE